MKLSNEEDDKSNFLIKKLKNNMNRTVYQPERFNSAFKQRPLTTFKTKKTDFEKKANFTKNNFYVPKLSRDLIASKYSTYNLYQNKQSYIWGRNTSKRQINNNQYFAKEELVDRVMKLKKALNELNSQNTEQKIILYKQKKQLKKQNQILNLVKEKYFFENYYKNLEGNDLDELGSNSRYPDNDNKKSKSNPKQKNTDDIKSIINVEKCNNNPEIPANLNYLSNSGFKELYKNLEIQNEKKDKEIQSLKEQLEHNKFSNEAYLSNIKMQYKQIKEELNKKNGELNNLKKNSKCTKYNEIMKEKEIFENEMINIKSKYNKAMETYENYKICLKRIKYLIQEINIKENKIEFLETKLKLFVKSSEENIGYLKNELNKKDKKIIKLENEKKKLNIKVNASGENKYLLLQISKNSDFIIKANIDKKEQEMKPVKDNSDFEKLNEEKKDNYINHNMNFKSNTEEKNIDTLLNQKDNEINLNNEENKENKENTNINIEKEKEEINEKQNIGNNDEKKEKKEFENNQIKNENFNEIMNLNIELLLMYIELTKRNINIEEIINEVFSKLNQENTVLDNKKIYNDYFVGYFKILDDEGKKIIEDLSNKEFEENKTLDNIKNKHTQVFNIFNNKEKEEKLKEEEFNKKLKEIDENKFQNLV